MSRLAIVLSNAKQNELRVVSSLQDAESGNQTARVAPVNHTKSCGKHLKLSPVTIWLYIPLPVPLSLHALTLQP